MHLPLQKPEILPDPHLLMEVSFATVGSTWGDDAKLLPGSSCLGQCSSRIYFMQFEALEFRNVEACVSRCVQELIAQALGGQEKPGFRSLCYLSMCDFSQVT